MRLWLADIDRLVGIVGTLVAALTALVAIVTIRSLAIARDTPTSSSSWFSVLRVSAPRSTSRWLVRGLLLQERSAVGNHIGIELLEGVGRVPRLNQAARLIKRLLGNGINNRLVRGSSKGRCCDVLHCRVGLRGDVRVED